jgi:hypothetical protein
MANTGLKQKCLAILRGMDSKQANVREHLIHKKSRKQITFSGTYLIPPARYVESDSHEPTSFFYPDYNCRLWNYTRSCFCFQQQTVGLHLLVGCTTDRELHPAPKVFIWLLRLYPATHKLYNSCVRVFYISVRFDNAIDGADGHALG